MGFFSFGLYDLSFVDVEVAPAFSVDLKGIPPGVTLLIRRRLAAIDRAIPGLVVSDDVEFLNGLVHRVAVEYDANAAGAEGGGGDNAGDGDRAEDWQRVIGLEDVPCRCVMKRPKNIELGDRPSTTLDWKVLFGQSLAIDRRNRLIYRDPDDGSLRYGYVQGRTVNAHEMNHHWTVTAIENPV
jgi:hypothetical protein